MEQAEKNIIPEKLNECAGHLATKNSEINSKLKILIVMPNYGHKQYILNYGLMSISAYLKHLGYYVDTLNLNHNEPSKLIEYLENNTYDVIGTGGLFIHYDIINDLIKTFHQYSPESKVVLGGGIASTDFEFILKTLKPNFLVVGEGESTVSRLLKAIENNEDYRMVGGILFLENNKLIDTGPPTLLQT